jgi:AraC family transcriptional regulator, arabinose operon regulatory protein
MEMDINPAIDRGLPKIKEGFQGQIACILPQHKRKFCASHPYCKKLYITDIGYYPNAAFHNRERKHGCKQFILIYCVKGEGWYTIKNKKFKVKANQYFILPVGTAHEYGAELKDPWSIYWVHYAGENAEYFTSYLLPKKGYSPVLVAPSLLRLMIFEDILNHIELHNSTGNLINANSSLYAFLASFQKLHLKLANKEENPIEDVIAFMKENLDKNLSLEDFAQHAHISPSHLSALFRQKTKYSPINLYTSFKIQKACQLLQDSGISIKMIANKFGFEDQYHFSRVFKKVMGISPKHFRESPL